jgi:hypothetical protein
MEYTGRFIIFSVITSIYNKKPNGPTLMELFIATKKWIRFLHNWRCSRCSRRVTWHTSIRYSSSCDTRVNMGALIFFTAAIIRAFRSARPRANGGRIPGLWHISKTKKKKQGLISGDLQGQSISCWSFPDARTIQRPGNTVFREWSTSQWKWARILSCCNKNVCMFCNCGISHG